MNAKSLALAAGAAAILAACSIGKPVPQATTYIVDAPPPAAVPATARRPETVRMGGVRMAAAFADKELVYRMDDVHYVSDAYNAFLADPGAMLGSRMADWLDRAGPFKAVIQPDSARPATYVLEAIATEVYGDFRPGQRPAAVMTVQFVLIDQSGPRPQAVFERSIGRRVEIGEAGPGALVRGYGKALAEILAELSGELRGVGAQQAR